MNLYEVILFAVSISLFVLLTNVSNTVRSFEAQISNNNSNVTALNERMSDLESDLNSIRLSKPLMGYDTLFVDAPEVLPPLPLNTVTATNLKDLMPILSVNTLYEITKVKDRYFLAYPFMDGSAFSIQILSSPYSDRVLKIVRTLRGESIPAFEIPYEKTNGLFVGIFPSYAVAFEYANSISKTIYPTVNSTLSSWLIRQIP